ncbi:hypothetical protein MRX96_013343 [Rhipicephalus microplus]
MRSAGGPPAAKLENTNENNQRAGSRTGKLWCYRSTTDDDNRFCKRDGLCGRLPATVYYPWDAPPGRQARKRRFRGL